MPGPLPALLAVAFGAILVVAGCPSQPTAEPPGRATTPLRRLAPYELQNTILDLFPDVGIETSSLALPDEIEVMGFNNNAVAQQASPILVERYRAISEYVAGRMTTQLYDLCDTVETDEACARVILDTHGWRIFRRPLTTEEEDIHVAFFMEQKHAWGGDTAITLLLQALLQAPSFLYRLEPGEPGDDPYRIPMTSWEIASRMSYFLWGSLPDEALFAQARSDALRDPAVREAEARRMLEHPRARQQVQEFHRQWLGTNILNEIDKDEFLYPEWNADLVSALEEEVSRFSEYVVFDGPGDLEALLTADYTLVNEQLAWIYGVDPPVEGWELTLLPPGERAGILTQASLLAATGQPIYPSPVLRGIFVQQHLLCNPLTPPGAAVDTTIESRDIGATTNRDRYAAHTQDPACASCHAPIDGVGFGFEGYDSLGRRIQEDNGVPIDESGELMDSDVDGPFVGAVELASLLAESDQVRQCYTRHWFRWAWGRSEFPSDLEAIDGLWQGARVGGWTQIQDLLVNFVVHDDFAIRVTGGTE